MMWLLMLKKMMPDANQAATIWNKTVFAAQGEQSGAAAVRFSPAESSSCPPPLPITQNETVLFHLPASEA